MMRDKKGRYVKTGKPPKKAMKVTQEEQALILATRHTNTRCLHCKKVITSRTLVLAESAPLELAFETYCSYKHMFLYLSDIYQEEMDCKAPNPVK